MTYENTQTQEESPFRAINAHLRHLAGRVNNDGVVMNLENGQKTILN